MKCLVKVGTAPSGPAAAICACALDSIYDWRDPETCYVASGTLRKVLGHGVLLFCEKRGCGGMLPKPRLQCPRLELAVPLSSLAFDFLIKLFVPCGLNPSSLLPRFLSSPARGSLSPDLPVEGTGVSDSPEPGPRPAGPRRGQGCMEMAREAGGRGGDLFRE